MIFEAMKLKQLPYILLDVHALLGKLLPQLAPPQSALMPLPSHFIPGCAVSNEGQCLAFQAGIQPEIHRD